MKVQGTKMRRDTILSPQPAQPTNPHQQQPSRLGRRETGLLSSAVAPTRIHPKSPGSHSYHAMGLESQHNNLPGRSEVGGLHDIGLFGLFDNNNNKQPQFGNFANSAWAQLMPEESSSTIISDNRGGTEPFTLLSGAGFDPEDLPTYGSAQPTLNSLQRYPSPCGESPASEYDDAWRLGPPNSSLYQSRSFDRVEGPTNGLRPSHSRPSFESCPSLINEPWCSLPPELRPRRDAGHHSVDSSNSFDYNGRPIVHRLGSFTSSTESRAAHPGFISHVVNHDLDGRDIDADPLPLTSFPVYKPPDIPRYDALNNGASQHFDGTRSEDPYVHWPTPQPGNSIRRTNRRIQIPAEQGVLGLPTPLEEPSAIGPTNQVNTSWSTDQDGMPNHDCFIHEDGLGTPVRSELPHRKGARCGHLPPDKAKIIAMRRKAGTTCMRCRILRIECDGGSPCSRCEKAKESVPLLHPCMKAQFVEIIESGTCNYIAQKAINHFTIDESRRVQMFFPEGFNINQLLDLLKSRRRKFHIRARQASGSLYVLDLARCYDFLVRVNQKQNGEKQDNLQNFIDNTLVKTENWFSCVRECNPAKNKTALLLRWNNMPSRASYDIVSLEEGDPDRPLDPENDEDKAEILIAAQMSRIICRKQEIDGYRDMQKNINNIRDRSVEEKLKFAHELGQILVSLRWRMSWWELLGDGSKEPDPLRDKYIERVTILSRTLYFYYFTVIKVGAWNDMTSLKGVMSSYPDASPVFEDFPMVRSIQGFEDWMEHGKVLIRKANVQNRFSK